MKQFNGRVKRVLVYGLDDWIGLWVFLEEAEKSTPLPADIREHVLDDIQLLMSCGLIEVGDVESRGFIPWNESIQQARQEILRRWHQLGRDPAEGDVASFKLTSRGKLIAQALLESGEDLGFIEE
ncbi:MAG: hypothetical protein WEB52_07990 [Dehalococcoidia bacterium]